MVIDIHAHPYFKNWFPGEHDPGSFHEPPVTWQNIYRRMHGEELTLSTVEEYRQIMDRANIERTAFFVRDIETKNGEAPANDWVIELASQEEAFIPFFAVDPNKGELGAKKLRQAVTERGVKGAKIHPYGAELYPDDECAYPIYHAASELGIPIIFHTGPGPLGTPIDYCHPRHFDGIAREFPELTIVLAHFSGPWHDEAHFLAWRYENVYVDISFMPEVYLDQLPWEYYAETIGDSILFGTDYPLADPVNRVSYVEQLDIPKTVKKNILEDNAVEILSG